MKSLAFAALTCAICATGCTFNQTPPVGQTTVIEKERPVVNEHVIERPANPAPAVHNDIHVDAPR